MLDALVPPHTFNYAVMLFTAEQRLMTPYQQIVQSDAADDPGNHAQVKLAYKPHCHAAGVCRQWRIHVNLCGYKLVRHSGMTLSARFHQVGAIDRGLRIARRQNVMHSVTTGTVGYNLRPEFGRQPMVARQIGGGAARFNPEFLRKSHSLVATGARDPRDVLAGNR